MLPDLFRLIGSDRYLAPEEVDRAAEPHSLTQQAWDVYRTHFQSFTGATLASVPNATGMCARNFIRMKR